MMVNDILFITGWVIAPFLWLYTLRIGGMGFAKLSIPSFVVIFIFIFQYIGFPILFFGLDAYRAEFVTDQNLLVKVWAITSLTTLLLCIGSVLGSLVLGRLRFFRERSNQSEVPSLFCLIRTYFLGLLSLVVLYLYISKLGFNNIALVAAIDGAAQSEVALIRSGMGNDFGSGYHWYNLFMRDALIFVTLIFVALRLQKLASIPWVVLFVFNGAVIFSSVMATEKGLFVDYLIALCVLYVIIKKRGEVPLSATINISIPILGSLVFFYMFFMNDASIAAGFSSIFSRTFTGSLQPSYHYLEFFPKYQDWLNGSSFPNPGGFLPFAPYNLTVEVMNFVQPEHLKSGVVGTMPAIYWAEVYANFGYYGLTLFPILVGFGLYLINWIIFKLHLNAVNASLFALLLLHYKNLSISGIGMLLFDLKLFVIVILYFLITIPIYSSCQVSPKN